jgi:hypothetical protein
MLGLFSMPIDIWALLIIGVFIVGGLWMCSEYVEKQRIISQEKQRQQINIQEQERERVRQQEELSLSSQERKPTEVAPESLPSVEEKKIKDESKTERTQNIPEVSNEFAMPVNYVPPNAIKLVLTKAVITLPNGESKPANVNNYEVRNRNVLVVHTSDYYPKGSQLRCTWNFVIRQNSVAFPRQNAFVHRRF